ncbi:MAG: hypothetical protein JWN43_294, partial [Gammaproteobacteria bacterium]|nr:hypothetical protein [Gammaproteobacteria bacterium]
MWELQKARSRKRVVLNQLVIIPMLLAAAACGGGKSQSPSATPEVNTLSPGTTTSQPSAIQVQVSPALTPSFDPSIHDYVINCTSSPEVQFTAWLPGTRTFGFFGPGEKASAPLTYPVGYFQKTLPLSAGQRFRFVAGQSSEYSVRCLPKDFPPLTATISGTRQAEWYLFAPTLTLGSLIPSYYVVVTDANGTPVWWKLEPGSSAMDAK